MDAVRREVQRVDSDQAVFPIQTVAEIVAADRWWQRTWSLTFGRATRLDPIVTLRD